MRSLGYFSLGMGNRTVSFIGWSPGDGSKDINRGKCTDIVRREDYCDLIIEMGFVSYMLVGMEIQKRV